MKTDFDTLEKMIIKANQMSKEDNRERFGTANVVVHEKYDCEAEILQKTKLARKTDLTVVCRAHFEMNRLNKEFGSCFITDDLIKLDDGKWKFSIEELKQIDINELIALHTHDTYWIIDFLKESYLTIITNKKQEENCIYENGKLVVSKVDGKTKIVKTISEYLKLDNTNEIHANLIKVLERIYDHYTEYNSFEAVDEITNTERDLKKELLEEDYEELVSNLCDDEDNIETILEYHIYHYCSKSEARKILFYVRDLLEKGYKLSDIKQLTPDSNWEEIITGILEDTDYFEAPELEEDWVDLFDVEVLSEECKREAIKREKSEGGKKSKQNHSEPICIRNKETNEVLSFTSAKECAEYLQTSTKTINRFKKGETKLNKIWEIYEVPF